MKRSRGALLDRSVNVRDAALFIPATEGKRTELAYLGRFGSSRVHVEVLPTGEDNWSAPNHVAARLREIHQRYDLQAGDQLWLVCDVDRWHAKVLKGACQAAVQVGARLAVSNPCFELWLLLQVAEADLARCGCCKDIEEQIREVLGSYNKSAPDCSSYTRDAIRTAIERAKLLETRPTTRWPTTIGTRVYRLMEELGKRGAIRDALP